MEVGACLGPMVYNGSYETALFSTQNYWVFELFPSSGSLENRKHDVSETGSLSVLM
jgi:hypothetical protein